MHTPSEIGIDNFQADRSPTAHVPHQPAGGLWSHQKGGFYHDGRFPTCDVGGQALQHHFQLGLTAEQQDDLVQYLLSLCPDLCDRSHP